MRDESPAGMKSGDRKLVIAIDGPAGSGKSTLAALLARRYGYTNIETGAMYRALAFKAIESGVSRLWRTSRGLSWCRIQRVIAFCLMKPTSRSNCAAKR
jgi:cytidylate kinase